MPEKPYRDESRLREAYLDREWSTYRIADEFDVDPETIRKWLGKFGIERRDYSETQSMVVEREGPPQYDRDGDDQRLYQNREVLENLYVEQGYTQGEIGEMFGLSASTISDWVQRYELEKDDKFVSRTSGNPTNTGSRKGPASFSLGNSVWPWPYWSVNGRPVFVHRLLSVAKGEDPYKVYSGREHHTHHKNDIPFDNRPSNIKTISSKEHGEISRRRQTKGVGE